MDLVEAPQERQPVHQNMPEIERVIHQRDGEQVLDPGRQLKLLEQPPATTFHELRQRFHDGLLQSLQRGRA